jgi:hypothetical protein
VNCQPIKPLSRPDCASWAVFDYLTMFVGLIEFGDRVKMWIADWFRRKAKTASSPETGSHFVAQLKVRMMPMHRGTVFEDPIDEFLRQHRLGEVTGGGTKMAPEPDGISHCDAEMRLEKASDTGASQVIEFLENLGAPKGSVFRQASRGGSETFWLGRSAWIVLERHRFAPRSLCVHAN